MKRALLILLVATACFGQGLTLRSPLRDIAPLAGSALLIDENFEGTGTPSPWSVGLGTPNFDNTSSPIAGAQDMLMDASVDSESYCTFANSAEVWVQFEITINSIPNASSFLAVFYDDPPTSGVYVKMDTVGRLIIGRAGADSSQTTANLSTSTRTWVFVHILKGSGSNAAYDVEFSATSTRTGSGIGFTSVSNGALVVNTGRLYFDRFNAEWGSTKTYHIDNVKVSNIGWPP